MNATLTTLKTSKASISLLEDGLIYLDFLEKGSDINLADTLEIFEARKAIDPTPNKQRVLVSLLNNPLPDKDSRAFAKTDEMSSRTLGMAILVDSLFNKVVGNFFIGAGRGNYPVQIFTKKEDAIKWLKKLPAVVEVGY